MLLIKAQLSTGVSTWALFDAEQCIAKLRPMMPFTPDKHTSLLDERTYTLLRLLDFIIANALVWNFYIFNEKLLNNTIILILQLTPKCGPIFLQLNEVSPFWWTSKV